MKDLWEVEFEKYINSLEYIPSNKHIATEEGFFAGWQAAIESVIKKMEVRNG